jgi:hypothetical protein
MKDIYMWNIRILSPMVQKKIAQVKVFSLRCDADINADTEGHDIIALRTVIPASLKSERP